MGTSTEKKELFFCPLLTCPLALQCRLQGPEASRGKNRWGKWGMSQAVCPPRCKDCCEDCGFWDAELLWGNGDAVCSDAHRSLSRDGCCFRCIRVPVSRRHNEARSQTWKGRARGCNSAAQPSECPPFSFTLCICFLLLAHCSPVHSSQIPLLKRLRGPFPNFTGKESDGSSLSQVCTAPPVSCGWGGHIVWVWQPVQGAEEGKCGWGSPEEIFTLGNRWCAPGSNNIWEAVYCHFLSIVQILSICLLRH